MKPLLKLLHSIWFLLLSSFCCASVITASALPAVVMPFNYGGQSQTRIAYDGAFLSVFNYDSASKLPTDEIGSPTAATRSAFAGFSKLLAAKTGAKDLNYLYQKVGAQGEHLKFGVTKNPATRYTQEELAGGRLRIVGQGERSEMLRLERQLHETLPIGPEERQLLYIQKQIEKGLKPPPYNP